MGERRTLTGLPAAIARAALIGISLGCILDILNVAQYFGFAYHRSQALALIFGFAAIHIFLTIPGTKRSPVLDRVPWYDWVLILAAVAANGYVAVVFGQMASMMEIATPERVVLGIVGILLTFEMVRRTTGWLLIGFASVFILYARFSDMVPDVLYARPSSWERLLTYLYFDPSGLYGVALDVIIGVVLAFIVFGNLLFGSGGGQFVTDVSQRLVGRFRGGPAKVAVVSSSLFGTMTGSAAANSVFTGVVTIPMMKRVGYKPAFAAAVEAVASSGGLIMPPVMGAAAFIMADFMRVPYSDVVLAALFPALLFYVAVFAQVHMVARRENLVSAPPIETMSPGDIVKGFVLFAAPLAVLVYFLLFRNFSPERSVLYASLAILALCLIVKRDMLRPRALLDILEKSGAELIQMMVIAGIAGLILGVVTLKGLGSSLSQSLLLIAGDNLFVLLVLTAVASIILGMGLPAVAIYILLAVLVAPALIDLGVPVMAAHLFIFYFGILSYVTPPMAFACFVTAPMAGADPFKVGIEGCKLSAVAYIVPFLFVYFPALLMEGDVWSIAVAVATAAIGSLCIAAAIAGFTIRRLGPIERIVFAIAGLGLMVRDPVIETVAAVMLVAILVRLVRTREIPEAVAT